MKGKSAETAVGHIEKALCYKKYTLVAFRDIAGVVNDIKPESIIESGCYINCRKAFIESTLGWKLNSNNCLNECTT